MTNCLKKLTSMLIVFVMVFTYMGQMLEAIAAGDNNDANESNVEFNSYFEVDGKHSNEVKTDIEESAILTLEVSPKNVGKGFIKDGTIRASAIEDNDINFKFSKIIDIKQENENLSNIKEKEENIDDNKNENIKESNKIEINETNPNIMVGQKEDDEQVNEVQNKKEIEIEEDKLINEDEVVQDILEEVEKEDEQDEMLNHYQILINSDNEIKINNILDKTIIKVEIEYNKEDIDSSKLSKEIDLKLNVKYIDLDLNGKGETIVNKIIVTWLYEGKQADVISDKEEVKSENGGVISYTMTTDDGLISKGKINANYNSEEVIYETEFTNTVHLDISTTSIAYEEIKINLEKENYIDAKGTVFETNDIYYKKVKFNGEQINEILEKGGIIEIQDKSGNLLNTIDSQKASEIELEGNPSALYIVIKNVTVSRNIDIECTKAIGKSSYDKATFNTFREIESCISGSVKYENNEKVNELSEISVKKLMKSSQTVANIVISNSDFNTLKTNENVELKISLNNDTFDSDLYVNPSFEIVFPEYVTDVTVQNINITYAQGLRIGDFHTYTANGRVKMKVNLIGVQSEFSSSSLTHGTNIIVSTNITVNEYAPSKKDEIRMYYFNQGVTNYASQTKWTISEKIPSGILRETNGFEAMIINYSAPSGLVTSSSITNYDGIMGVVKSIRQGEKTAKIDRDANSRIATMDLYVANNTGKNVTDVVLIGRVPFKDNKEVITNDDLGTTIDTKMVSQIREISNINENNIMIYYSDKENATSDLSNPNNSWVENPGELADVKSYMIVVQGELAAGAVLTFGYNFQIPANLTYNTAIFGSFGGYYNNGDETTLADKVGLQTELSIPINMELTSDIAENVGVGEGRFINYTLTVTNYSEETLYDIDISNNLPEGTTFYKKSTDVSQGDNGLIETNLSTKNWTIDELKPDDVYVQEYIVKVNSGMADKTIKNFATAVMKDMTQVSNINEVKVFASSLNIEVSKNCENSIPIGNSVTYTIKVTNITEKNEKNVKLVYKNPEELGIDSIMDSNGEVEYKINAQKHEIIYTIPELTAGETKTFYINQTAKKENANGITSIINFELEDGAIEKSSEINFKILGNNLKLTQEANIDFNTIHAGEEIKLTLNIENNGKFDISDVQIRNTLSEFIEPSLISVSNGSYSYMDACNHDINEEISINSGGVAQIVVFGTVKENAQGNVIHNRWTVTNENMKDMNTDEMLITITEAENKTEETEVIEEEDIDTGIYSISGIAWIDINGNGKKDEEDIEGAKTEVSLMKDGKVVQKVQTNSDGMYIFENLSVGEYIVVTNYDSNLYETTSYASEISSNDNSNVYEVEKGVAVTDSVSITNSNIETLDIGLIEKDRFDFEIAQSIVKATVIVNGNEKVYDYDNLDLAKLELTSSELKDAVVKFEYKIRVTNVGNIDGKVSSIVNYMPQGTTFSESDNPFWASDSSGNKIYYSGLKNTVISSKDFQDVTLILEKKLTKEDNIGIVNDKSGIAYTESKMRITEAKTNNFTAQQTIIAKSAESNTLKIIISTIIIFVIGIFGYMIKNDKIDIKKLIQVVYK